MANFFEIAPLSMRNEILHLEAKEFGDRLYFSNLEIRGSSLKRVPDLGNFHKRSLHFLHSIITRAVEQGLVKLLLTASFGI